MIGIDCALSLDWDCVTNVVTVFEKTNKEGNLRKGLVFVRLGAQNSTFYA